MTRIKETRNLIIKNKVLTTDDVKSLSKLYSNQLNEIILKAREFQRKKLIEKKYDSADIEERLNKLGYITVELSSNDGSKLAGNVEDLIETEDFLSNHKVVEVKFYFFEDVFDSKIYIRIQHSNYRAAEIEIEGTDRTWVIGTIKKIDDFFKNCKEQQTIHKEYKWLIIISFAVIFGLITINLFNYIQMRINPESSSLYHSWKTLSFLLFASGFAGIPAASIYDKIEALWPTIELQTGKDFQQMEKIKRAKVNRFILAIVIPLLLSFIPLLFEK